MVKTTLQKKLIRDMRQSSTQFIALILLCVLGTFLFAGLYGTHKMTKVTNDTYFEENNLADFWITLPSADRTALERIRNIPGVTAATSRFTLDGEGVMPNEPTINITAYDGAMTINSPIVSQGQALDVNDVRGCLMQSGFATANGFSVGDRVTVRLANIDYTFFVRGIVYSPEFISVSNQVAFDPYEFGYILVNAQAFFQIPLTQIIATIEDSSNAASIREAMAQALPQAFIIDRAAHRSTSAAQDNVSMFFSLSLVFPVAAFIVAALIVMTTLTRMIDNQRMQIGTLRSLGYASGTIQRHYLSYAIWPSLIGSLAGALIGHYTLPPLIWDLLIAQYEYPYRFEPPMSLPAWIMVGFSVFLSAGICLSTYRKTRKESTAALLRAKPPKDGKRIFLERIPRLWQQLKFNSKMVMRNLMRSKMRTLMSCIGILCCNALLIASFGLQDSVSDTIRNHYEKSMGYDVQVVLNSQAGTLESYKSRLDADIVECTMMNSVQVIHNDENRTTLLTVVENHQQLLHLGPKEAYQAIDSGTAAVTIKLANALKIKVGDVLTFQLPGDDQPFSLTVAQLVHNNLSQGIYITRSTWDGLRKGAFVPTSIQLLNPTAECISQLSSLDEVERIDYVADQITDMMQAIDMVSSIFYLIMIIALALAFVICYNMGLINFAERTREYATLKVLGYHQKEIRKLILRENMIITAFAILFSIYPGLGLTDLVLIMCETEAVVYVTQVKLLSILLSCVITYLFAYLIQRLLVRKVRNIVMVEALKSIE